MYDDVSDFKVLFSSEKNLDFDTLAFLFLFDKYHSIID